MVCRDLEACFFSPPPECVISGFPAAVSSNGVSLVDTEGWPM